MLNVNEKNGTVSIDSLKRAFEILSVWKKMSVDNKKTVNVK